MVNATHGAETMTTSEEHAEIFAGFVPPDEVERAQTIGKIYQELRDKGLSSQDAICAARKLVDLVSRSHQ